MQVSTVARREPSGPLRLVTAGYLIERKGLADLVEAVVELAAAGSGVVLDVAGDGPEATRLDALVRRYGASQVVRFHGWLAHEQLSKLVASADVYVSMSRAESWGQAMAEALARGLVAVSAANTGARAMAALGAPVHLVPIGDRRALGDELRRLCAADRASLTDTGASGIRWAQAHVAGPVIAGQWASLYRDVMDRSRQGGPANAGKDPAA
jgi:glycosyltransferase involved in cell wall biosynthesis